MITMVYIQFTAIRIAFLSLRCRFIFSIDWKELGQLVTGD